MSSSSRKDKHDKHDKHDKRVSFGTSSNSSATSDSGVGSSLDGKRKSGRDGASSKDKQRGSPDLGNAMTEDELRRQRASAANPLQNALDVANEELERLKKRFAAKRDELKTEQARRAETESHVARLRDENDALMRHLDILRGQHTAASQAASAASTNGIRREQDLARVWAANDQLVNDNHRLRAENTELATQLAEIKAWINSQMPPAMPPAMPPHHPGQQLQPAEYRYTGRPGSSASTSPGGRPRPNSGSTTGSSGEGDAHLRERFRRMSHGPDAPQGQRPPPTFHATVPRTMPEAPQPGDYRPLPL